MCITTVLSEINTCSSELKNWIAASEQCMMPGIQNKAVSDNIQGRNAYNFKRKGLGYDMLSRE